MIASRAERVVCGLAVLALFVSLVFTVHPWFDLRNDASMYVVTARALQTDGSYEYLGLPMRLRPPGFPALVALVLAVVGTNFQALNLMTSLFGAAALLLLYAHQRPRTGWVLALLTSAALWINPGYQRLCNQVMSEMPGLALLLTVFLVERWSWRRPGPSREILLGACIGLSMWVRGASLLLIPAIVLSRLLRERFTLSFAMRRIALFSVVAGLVIAPWVLRNSKLESPVPAEQIFVHTISTGMWRVDPGDPSSRKLSAGEVLARVPERWRQSCAVLGSRLAHRIPGDPPLSGASLALHMAISVLLLGCTVWVALRRREAAEIFALATALVVGIYFGFTDRLLLAVYVIGFAATVNVIGDLAQRWHRRGAKPAVGVMLGVLALADLKPRRDWDRIRDTHALHETLAEALDEQVGPDARIASTEGFHYSVFLERPVYSLLYAAMRAGRPEAVEGVIDRYEIDVVLLAPTVPSERDFTRYFERHYGPGKRAAFARWWQVRSGPAPK